MIADNEERRQGDDNPMRKARRAEFLRQYRSIRDGRPSKPDQIGLVKTMADVADASGTLHPEQGAISPEGQIGLRVKTLTNVAETIGETVYKVQKNSHKSQ